MDEQPGAYAPQSPDLSAFASTSSYDNNNTNINNDNSSNNGNNTAGSYNLAPPTEQPFPPKPMHQDTFSLPQSSYYQPPPALQPSSSYGYQPYAPFSQDLQFESPAASKRIKRDPEDDPWLQYPTQQQPPLQQPQFPPTPDQMAPTAPSTQEARRGRPPNSSGKKMSKSSAATKLEEQASEPAAPAPGELEGINVRTKFPVARIKRIVQADDEVGKVAQATPVAVGKALELFMIHLTLASAEAATGSAAFGRRGANAGGGTKRLTSAHVKAAILKHDEFDFLRPIADKIPDGPGGSKGAAGDSATSSKAKGESDDHSDFEDSPDDDPSYGSRSKKKAAGRR